MSSVSSPGESDLEGCGRWLLVRATRVRLWTLQGSRPGKTTFSFVSCTLGGGGVRVWYGVGLGGLHSRGEETVNGALRRWWGRMLRLGAGYKIFTS